MNEVPELSKQDQALMAEMGGEEALMEVQAKDLIPGDVILVSVGHKNNGQYNSTWTLRRVTGVHRCRIKKHGQVLQDKLAIEITPGLPSGGFLFVCNETTIMRAFRLAPEPAT